MNEKARLFLTRTEALEAIRIDFAQYAPQARLFCNLVPQVFGQDALVSPGPATDEFWIRPRRTGALQRVTGRQLGDLLLERLAVDPPPLASLASICYQVFQARTVPGSQQECRGLWVETGMEAFSCRQCGRCCRALQFRDTGTAEDFRRLSRLGRDDILAWMVPVRREGRIVSCRLWLDPATGRFAEACPWLVETVPDRFACRIHDVRPEICRQYPGTRKHAEMTGCIGFRSGSP